MMYTPPAGSYKSQHHKEMKNSDISAVHVFSEIQFSLLYVYMYKWGCGWWNLTVEHHPQDIQ